MEGETNDNNKNESDEEEKDSGDEKKDTEGCRDNRDIVDNNQAQAMSSKEITDLKNQGNLD